MEAFAAHCAIFRFKSQKNPACTKSSGEPISECQNQTVEQGVGDGWLVQIRMPRTDWQLVSLATCNVPLHITNCQNQCPAKFQSCLLVPPAVPFFTGGLSEVHE